ncbi:RNA polymerase sigma factor [Xanthobacteraceae bacterium A53D]
MADRFDADMIALLPQLRRFAISLCRSGDIADDLVQATAERAYAARATFAPGAPMAPWLFRILRNAWLDQLRRRRTMGVVLDTDEIDRASAMDGEAAAEATLTLRTVETAMATLSEDQRIILHLVCIEELSYAEAAEVLDIPKGTVMSRLARARLALAERLGIK